VAARNAYAKPFTNIVRFILISSRPSTLGTDFSLTL
jgi:hypothetical protein